MNEIKEYTEKIFEDIKHFDEEGNEYWYARELQTALDYKEWRKFENVIYKAKIACNNSNIDINEQFVGIDKLSINVNGGKRIINDYKLSRYACYLIAQNGDSRKKTIALAQTYFAIQTRKQELSEKEYSMLTEDEKRFYQRNLTRKGNYSLNMVARNVGVRNFDKFHNAGYKGLYGGETANDIAKSYNENTVAADQKFKDKKFKVIGTVADISTDLLGDPYVTLRGGVNQFMEPQFGFEKSDSAQLAKLKKGSKVTLICTGKGDVAKTPMSGSCSLL